MLWLADNQISSLQGLSSLPRLRELNLARNDVSTLGTALAANTALQVGARALRGGGSQLALPGLRPVVPDNLAAHSLLSVKAAPAPHTHAHTFLLGGAQVLNLADNRLASLRDVGALSCLPALRDLCLADPLWGECPVAGLCNYQTYALHALPGLTALDTLLLAPETKAAAQAGLGSL